MNKLEEPFIITLQIIDTQAWVPEKALIQQWITTSLQGRMKSAELCIRIVDKKEITALNRDYRHQNKPTNVLAFNYTDGEPIHIPDTDIPYLGDIVICAAILSEEAIEQSKTPTAHWAHLCIHGLLHLLGYDHMNAQEAHTMESLEIKLLQQLNFPNPYEEG